MSAPHFTAPGDHLPPPAPCSAAPVTAATLPSWAPGAAAALHGCRHPHVILIPTRGLQTLPAAGRAEPIRLALAAKLGVEFEVQGIDYGEMKSNLELYPFAQCPRRVSTLLRPCSQPCLQEVPQLRCSSRRNRAGSPSSTGITTQSGPFAASVRPFPAAFCRYADDEVDICQSTTILHHIGEQQP